MTQERIDELEAGKAPLAILRDANEDWYYGILEKFLVSRYTKEI